MYKYRQIYITIFLLLCMAFVGAQTAKAGVIQVNPGDDVAAIIQNANGGDELVFSPGTYSKVLIQNRQFTENAPLIIKSDGTGEVIFETVTNTGTAFKIINSSYIVLQGVFVRGGLNGIVLEGSDHIMILNNDISGPGQAGIHVHYSCSYVDIIGNHIYNTGLRNSQYGEGIYVGTGNYAYTTFPDNCENIWIENNELHHCGNGEAINIKGESFHVTVRDNVMFDIAPGTATQYNQAAVTVEAASVSITNDYRLDEWRDTWVENNIIYNVAGGYEERSSNNGIMFGGSGCYIIGNTVFNCEERGLYGNSFKSLGFDTYVYNNNTYDNGINTLYNSALTILDQDPGPNPNVPQNWYSAPAFSVDTVLLDLTSVLMEVGDKQQLVDQVLPLMANDRSVTWSSSNTNVVTVDENGLLRAIGLGQGIISVVSTDGSKTATCSVIVNDGDIALGNTAIYPMISTASNRSAIPVMVTHPGAINEISIYHEGGTGNMLLGVYEGEVAPTNLLSNTAITAVNATAGWQHLPLDSLVEVNLGQKIWLAWNFENNPGIHYQSGSPGVHHSSGSWQSGMPLTFGATTEENKVYSIFASLDPENIPPSIELTNPSAGILEINPGLALVELLASANDLDGEVTHVNFFVDGNLVGSANGSPFTVDWVNVSAGTYSLSATVQDNEGAVAYSDTSMVTITEKDLVPGTVGITDVLGINTTNNKRRAQPFVMPEDGRIESMSMYHNAGSGGMILAIYNGTSAPDSLLAITPVTPVDNVEGWQTIGLLDSVEVSAGETVWLAWLYESNPGIRYDKGSPGRFDSNIAWIGGMPALFGSGTQGTAMYSLYASYVPTSNPYVNLTSPAEGAVFSAPADIEVTAEVLNIEGLSELTFFQDSLPLQTLQSGPYTFNWADVSPGAYSLYAVATDSASNEVVSEIVNFTVESPDSLLNTIGITDRLASATNYINRRAVPYTMPENGTIESISMYHLAGNGNMLLAVYEGDSVPTNRIAITPLTTVNQVDGWQKVMLETPISVNAGETVWLAWVYENATVIYYESGSPGRFDSGKTWSGGMPEEFGSGTQGNAVYSIYASYIPDAAPAVNLISPLDGAVYDAPAAIEMTAEVFNMEGLSQVIFYQDSVPLQAVYTAPYTFTWQDIFPGVYSVYASAMDSSSNEVFSELVNFTVESPDSLLNTVGITSRLASATNNANRRAVPYTMPENGKIESVTMYHRAGTGNMLLAVYEGDSTPTNRIAITPLTPVSQTDGWQEVLLESAISVGVGETIWLAWVYESPTSIYYESGSPGRFDSGDNWTGGMPEQFGSGSQGDALYSIYASYVVEESIGDTTSSENKDKKVKTGKKPKVKVYPNPFEYEVSIGYEISETSQVLLVIYDLNGNEINRLDQGQVESGYHEIHWDLSQSNAANKKLFVYHLSVVTESEDHLIMGKLKVK
ncbi:Ig-like domain-containing protein [Echinicola vietnamensis]|uniref:Ig-like domain-containing surface protein n=1 Tax=Echinicola vietnamensis (strain DSM 17526 / LMG 23754 / KMM 6221) TaxID=926556 RepID=L0G501_ECHVK|nr:Ig-like domain-containing protein [Echinicola vietnamensis]AGA80398.1 Ig-like domain-containing surface protein [Echinicola vietnamensis DSM 17526]